MFFEKRDVKTLHTAVHCSYLGINNARAPLFGLVNVCAFLNKPRLISLTLQI